MGHWRVATMARAHSESHIAGKIHKVREIVETFESNKYVGNKFYMPDEYGNSKAIRYLDNWMKMHKQPPLERIYLPKWVKILNSPDYREGLQDLSNLHSHTDWRVADYATDPPMPSNRLLDSIDRILVDDRKRQDRRK
jgi:hypothetical protein